MEQYPSIGVQIVDTPIIAFDKIDGSNIRAEWSPKTGFNKFGTRTRLLDSSEKPLGEAVNIFNEKFADDLDRIFRKQKFTKATAFLEFYGENSFAGQHEDEEHYLSLFDVHIFKRGILPAREYLKLFGDLKICEPLYEGKANKDFIDEVRNSDLEGMTFEGVVCKSPHLGPKNRQIVFKIKSNAWLNKLKEKYGADSKMFNLLK